MTDVTITPTDTGPYLVEEAVRILDADGPACDLSEQAAIFLCRCGGSGTTPFCDGTHLTRQFEAAHRVGHTLGGPSLGLPIERHVRGCERAYFGTDSAADHAAMRTNERDEGRSDAR